MFDEQYITTKIESADIYLTGGRILRSGNVLLKKGMNRFCMIDLSQSMEAESIQLKIENIWNCHISEMQEVTVKQCLNEEKQIKEVKKEKESLQRRQQMYKLEMSAWEKNMDCTQRLNITMEEMMRYMQISVEKCREFSEKIYDLQQKIDVCQEKYEELEKELQKKKEMQNTHGVWVELYAEEEGEYPIELTYFEKDVFWKPFYDIRMLDINHPLNFCMKAKITQKTNENWENVSLKLFFGNMNYSNNRPILRPCYLERQNMRRYEGIPAYSPKAAVTSANRVETRPADRQSETVHEKTVVTQEMMIQYELPGVYRLEKGTRGTVIDVMQFEVPGKYHYYVAPKADTAAFLTVQVDDIIRYNLLSCRANLYLENTYIGKMDIPAKQMGETFLISLGRDRRIDVFRRKIKQYHSAAYFKGRESQSYKYEICVTNMKDEPAEITVVDQIPVSREKEITVEVTQKTEGVVDSVKGEISWNLNLQPKAKTVLCLEFVISYPKDWNLNLGNVDKVSYAEEESEQTIWRDGKRYCKACGAVVEAGRMFCVNCGSRV